ncbi:protein binding protein [Panicum miliaceum]|uniref:RING-type E3 ubiquitin transferase n=1 Tax=Panicum miliaceum TaxID=4540 RepID=A0A3L6S8N3_PANMI|nr:protein binding protein [Panicum miliaceum]
MDEESGAAASRYFCHMCSLIIWPELGIEEVKCPHCHTGFVEEMAVDRRGSDGAAIRGRAAGEAIVNAPDAALEREVSLWAPVLMDFLAASSGRQGHGHGLDATAGGGDLAAFARRQYRNIALLQLLNALQEGDTADEGRERVVVVSPADARTMLMGQERGDGAALGRGGLTLGDLFLGPGLDLLLEYLAETDPSRQGTPPARKETIAALPAVRVREAFTCPVCLDEVAAGCEAREMPCKHRFHDPCIVPWLEMHSSCPVCRHQLPAEEPAEPAGSGGRAGDVASGKTDACLKVPCAHTLWSTRCVTWRNVDRDKLKNAMSSGG